MQRISIHSAFTHPSRRIIASLLLAALPLLAVILTGGAAQARGAQRSSGGGGSVSGRAPGGRLNDPVVRAVDIAAPAVVRIGTIYRSHITLTFCNQSVTLPTSGDGYSEGVFGSGAFISANGDVLTADHVINVDHDTLEQQLLADPSADSDIANTLNSSACYGAGPAIRPSDINGGFLQFSGVTFKTTFDSPVVSVWRDTAYSGLRPGAVKNPADLLSALMAIPHDTATTLASSDFSHDDLAVLHVNERDTPSIRLDDSASVEPMDSLTVIGFPGNGDANNDPSTLLTPSFNLANVSAIKQNTDGAQLIQVGGNIEHGDSGGPVLDANGRIVGVVSFAGPDNLGITAFLRSSDSALRLISQAKVNMGPGAFERAWEQAFTDYASDTPGHWRRASSELNTLARRYPTFKGAAPYDAWAAAAARHEPLPQTRPTLAPVAVVALVILGALALAIIGVTLLAAGRGRPPSRSDLHDWLSRRRTHSAPDHPLGGEISPASQHLP